MLEYDVTGLDEKLRITRYVKVIIESFHSQAVGGGLLYFGVEAETGQRVILYFIFIYIVQPQYVTDHLASLKTLHLLRKCKEITLVKRLLLSAGKGLSLQTLLQLILSMWTILSL